MFSKINHRNYTSERFRLFLVGLSRDLRTNRWRVTSKCCGKEYEPATTMMARQTLECPKCGAKETVDYNNLTPID